MSVSSSNKISHRRTVFHPLLFLLPGLTAFLATVASATSFNVGLAYIMPMLNLMVVFYWAIYRPELLPPWVLFLLGLLQDVLYGLPLGMMSCINIVLFALTRKQQRFFLKEHFVFVWLGFAVFSAVAMLIYWLIASLYSGQALPIQDAAMQWLLSVLFYSCLHGMLCRVYTMLPEVT